MINKGIWIDKEKAHIVTISEEKTDMITLLAEELLEQPSVLEKPGGAQEIIKDRRVLEREKHRVNSFIKSIIPKIENANNILVLGPSMMGQQFSKALEKDYPILGKRIKEVVKAEKMTDNQLKALVKNYNWPVG
ncbi:hypothetical protein [Winogradskyella alexanderae]|uniref:Host attachment protein n=1 Tax=Winogradskyella alexanderae TaxID=2877123 RepID=A0ABS7XTM7_9FLAO|nr:hypothetical protein [Winogradskyella alexanderae]MCA0133382.1 hypothetical protein [Winogradskyella alexanderae]